jgi:hypothetical protein
MAFIEKTIIMTLSSDGLFKLWDTEGVLILAFEIPSMMKRVIL